MLPDIAARAQREQRDARVWSAGCASGEEPYTLKILWDLEVVPPRPGVRLSIVATDVDAGMLARARKGCFAPTSLRELPPHLVGRAFDRAGRLFCIQPRYRLGIDFVRQDLRSEAPGSRFDLVLCRYVAWPTLSSGPTSGCRPVDCPHWLVGHISFRSKRCRGKQRLTTCRQIRFLLQLYLLSWQGDVI
jgi:hypothetical protein